MTRCRRLGCDSSAADADEIDNLEAWLTTVVARICLNILRDRRSHAEEPLDAFVPEPIISTDGEP